MGDSLHQAAIPHKRIGVMVDDRMAWTVELLSQERLSQRHANRVGESLTQRAGRGLDTGCDADLRMARRLGVQLTKVAQLIDRQVITGQVQQRVNQHRAMTVGQHKTITVGPGRINGVVTKVTREQCLRHLCHAHGCTRMA